MPTTETDCKCLLFLFILGPPRILGYGSVKVVPFAIESRMLPFLPAGDTVTFWPFDHRRALQLWCGSTTLVRRFQLSGPSNLYTFHNQTDCHTLPPFRLLFHFL
ncbi:hypothetical protein CPB84DRAFT_1779437 [Gymnopilus junonius]|uniref:Uncharacterized protein n=1 Tax=Gymnopilus junonius TaxID=109634 RepID=A0A9P5TN60_GYMJU|nr:hypothetical protein CPB84DRAFT_1779437 [Gymnopilus junonius]